MSELELLKATFPNATFVINQSPLEYYSTSNTDLYSIRLLIYNNHECKYRLFITMGGVVCYDNCDGDLEILLALATHYIINLSTSINNLLTNVMDIPF